jgi:hypothetical protein
MSAWSIAARAVRSTWSGPFDAGPLSHPVTVGDALLKLFQTIWRAGVVVVASIVVLAAAVGIYTLLQPAPLRTRIVASARVDAKACGDEFPLLVSFKNNSSETVRSVYFNLEAYTAGRSRNLAKDGYRTSDMIIPPLAESRQCWRLPVVESGTDLRLITYAAEVSSASDDPPF